MKLPLALTLFLAAGAIVAGPLAQSRKDAMSYTQPAENLLIIVADIQRHLNDDVYRYPYATDVTGQNLFRACLVRLANYETLYRGKLGDAVALAKAQAFEKLGGYDEAGRNYELAKKSDDEAIRKLADQGFERTRKFSGIVNRPVDMSALRIYQRDLERKIEDLDLLVTEFKSTPHQSLARLERERAQTQLAEFYVTMQFMRPYSPNDAIRQIKRNIDQNPESKRLYAHHLMLADFYYNLARQYTILADPERTGFDQKQFDGFANSARAEYHIVEKADGFPEKLEARAKLLALEAFVERVTEQAQ